MISPGWICIVTSNRHHRVPKFGRDRSPDGSGLRVEDLVRKDLALKHLALKGLALKDLGLKEWEP
jgi:hypothetical protein